MAYAEVAGLSPVNGLYALLLPAVLYTFLGSSRQLIVGPGGSISALVGAAVLPLAVAGSGEARSSRRCSPCSSPPASSSPGRPARLARRLLLAAGAVGYIHGSRSCSSAGSSGSSSGSTSTRPEPLGQLVEVVRELGGRELDDRARERDRARLRSSPLASSCRGCPPSLIVVVAAIVACRGRSTSPTTASPSSARSRPGCRASRCRRRRSRTSSTSSRPRSGSSSSASPTASSPRVVRRKRNQHIRANQELLAFCGVARLPGITRVSARRERLAHGGERPDGRTDAGRRPRRCRRDRARAPLPHDADVVPAEGGARRGDRLRGDRLVDPRRGAGSRPSAGSRSGSPPRRRSASSSSACSRRSRRGRALDRRRRPAQRAAARRRARLGRRLGRYANVELHPSARVTPGVVVYGSTTACSSRTPATSRGACARRFAARPTPARWLVFDAESVAHVDSTGARGARRARRPSSRRDGVGLVVARMKPHVQEQLSTPRASPRRSARSASSRRFVRRSRSASSTTRRALPVHVAYSGMNKQARHR